MWNNVYDRPAPPHFFVIRASQEIYLVLYIYFNRQPEMSDTISLGVRKSKKSVQTQQ